MKALPVELGEKIIRVTSGFKGHTITLFFVEDKKIIPLKAILICNEIEHKGGKGKASGARGGHSP